MLLYIGCKALAKKQPITVAIYLYYCSFCFDLNISLFSCALLFSSLFALSCFTQLTDDDFSFSDSALTLLEGLELGSRCFLDLDSDLEVPRTILDIFWTVLSVIDSALDNFGDLMAVSDPDLVLRSSLASLSSLKEPDLVTLTP